MNTETTRRWGAAAVAIAPVVLLAGFASHPFIERVPDDEAAATAAGEDLTRWAFAHLTVAVGSILAVLAFLALRRYLDDAGEQRSSPWALPLVIVGGTLYALLPVLELALVFVSEAGGDLQDGQAALTAYFIPIFAAGVLTHALGVLGFALGISRSQVLAPGTTRLVVTALAVMAVARAVPLGAVQFYVQGAAGIVALWPLAYAMWAHPVLRPQSGRVRCPRPEGESISPSWSRQPGGDVMIARGSRQGWM